MINAAIMCLCFYTNPDSTSSFISFVTDRPREVIIKSTNISNTLDPLVKIRDSSVTLRGGGAASNFNIQSTKDVCQERIINRITRLPISNLYINVIEIKHVHNNYEKFVNFAGTREVWVKEKSNEISSEIFKEKKIGGHTFPIRHLKKTLWATLSPGKEFMDDSGRLYLSHHTYNRRYSESFEVEPDHKYLFSFYYLVPRGGPSTVKCRFFLDKCADRGLYEGRVTGYTYELMDRSARWVRFQKYVKADHNITSLRFIFDVVNEGDDNVGDLIIRDFKLSRFEAVDKGP